MIQRICAIILFSCLYGLATAQQMPNNTLFDWNKINFNPAFSGTSNTTDIMIQTRQQWIDLKMLHGANIFWQMQCSKKE